MMVMGGRIWLKYQEWRVEERVKMVKGIVNHSRIGDNFQIPNFKSQTKDFELCLNFLTMITMMVPRAK